ncbi:hypothetical protein A0H81_10378 [Grifola frondosa]|uniref:Uncharacterized protein n=1 Tax=Grifola frondosa TaxID=5627 RepID=A0A1C7LZ07_GRIFR|nr:hypothetical protein A0H81_10378 [Grifola frondosa]
MPVRSQDKRQSPLNSGSTTTVPMKPKQEKYRALNGALQKHRALEANGRRRQYELKKKENEEKKAVERSAKIPGRKMTTEESLNAFRAAEAHAILTRLREEEAVLQRAEETKRREEELRKREERVRMREAGHVRVLVAKDKVQVLQQPQSLQLDGSPDGASPRTVVKRTKQATKYERQMKWLEKQVRRREAGGLVTLGRALRMEQMCARIGVRSV